jgi:hypothetical protein
MPSRGLGYLPDAPSDSDRLFSAHPKSLVSLPSSVSLWDRRCEIKDQGGTQSCVGQAFSQGLRLAYLHEGIDCPELSAEFLYYLARLQHGGENEDVGTYLRSCAQALKKFGAADEAVWPFEDWRVNKKPNLLALQSAYDRKGLKGYFRIEEGDTDGVRRALAAGCPVVAGWQISESFLDWEGGPIPEQTRDIVGGHALCLDGYRADGNFEGVNSWSVSWSDGGRFTATERFVRQASDLWALDVTP